MKKIEFSQLQETLFYEKLDSGLDVYLLPKRGFNKMYATFTTKYGSIDNHFVPPGKDEMQVPDGIAHFLEHKMFEDEKIDVFNEFSKYGAQANAFTSFDRTAYLFSATGQIKENLTTLLNFVQSPYFTEENVEKEKGIIEQEIRMYQDNPDWRVMFGFLRALYQHHPVNLDIAGTVESIHQITKDTLYTCYETFYHPSNMLLFIVGQIDPEEVIELVKENQSEKPFKEQAEIKRLFKEEPDPVAIPKNEIDLSIGQPKCMFGFKELKLGLQGEEMMKQELATKLLLDSMFGPSTDFYQRLLEDGFIDDSFGTDYNLEQYYGFTSIGGNTPKPEQLISSTKEYVEQMKESGIPQASFERSRKKTIGSFLKQMNSPEFIANQFTRYQFNDMNLFDIIPVLESIKYEEVNQRLHELMKEEQFAVCIVR